MIKLTYRYQSSLHITPPWVTTWVCHLLRSISGAALGLYWTCSQAAGSLLELLTNLRLHYDSLSRMLSIPVSCLERAKLSSLPCGTVSRIIRWVIMYGWRTLCLRTGIQYPKNPRYWGPNDLDLSEWSNWSRRIILSLSFRIIYEFTQLCISFKRHIILISRRIYYRLFLFDRRLFQQL